MRHDTGQDLQLPLEQRRIRAKCYHPTGTFIPFPKAAIEQSIPARFEQMVRQYPDRLAVKTRDHTLTYTELNQMANKVAQAIQSRHLPPDAPIAVLLGPEADGIAAIFGVMKAGRAFVALEPSFPRSRNRYVLENAQACLLVTNRQHLTLAAELTQHRGAVLSMNDLTVNACLENLNLPLSPDHFASLLYTSGSTGQPKGVIQSHGSRLHDVSTYTHSFHICADDRMAMLYPLSTGQGVTNILSTLLNGATLCPYDVKEAGISDLAAWMYQEAITLYLSIPMLFRQFAATLNTPGMCPDLRIIHVGAERVYPQDVALYQERFSSNCIFVTTLAANETGCVRRYFIDSTIKLSGSLVPIGYPVDGVEVLLFDEAGTPIVGDHQVGEIVIKSRYLAPGYWRQPELMQGVFSSDPDGGAERLYRTGDLGLMHPNGCLFHMGRKDFQVKIRGFTIEVAEIEVALLRLDSIAEVVVVGREGRSGDLYLVAYIVPAIPSIPGVSQLRRTLAETLPTYMIPSSFVVLQALPRTPNGKVDRRALPAPTRSRPVLERAYVTPRTPIEEELTCIWAELLDVE
ncbi:MAG: amino acid adenylation domain-containing protein, partial [Candidatus Tectomicrobia bacterium]